LAWCRAVLTSDQHGSIALALQNRGIMQLGLLLLVATLIARVAFSVLAFAQQHNCTYVIATLIVLAMLLYSLVGGYL
jgi:uncharacterized membrane protein